MKKLFCLLALAAAVASCGKPKNMRAAIDDSGMTTIALSDDDKIRLQDGVGDIELIPLESSGNVLVGSADGVIVTDENIVVYDTRQSHSVFIFGRDGKHRATINRKGRGPQEYLSLDHVALLPDGKTVAINDNHGGKVLHFTLDGRFVSSMPSGFWFVGMEYIDDNDIVCATYGAGESDPGLMDRENPTDLLWFTDARFGIKSSAMPVRYEGRGMVITPNISKSGDRVYVNRPYSDTIYQAGRDGLKALWRIGMEKIGGISNPDPGITREEFSALQERRATFHGDFVENDDYVSVSVATPPRNAMKSYLYSKASGKVYAVENEGVRAGEDIMPLFLGMPKTSAGDSFVTIVQSYHITSIGDGVAAKQYPELAGLTEESNPVVILYKFREGL